jgi:hypothetical protein
VPRHHRLPGVGLAGGACQGYGILLDIRNPASPRRLTEVADTNFATWHSVTFSNDGRKVLWTDEWGGGTAPRCRATDNPVWGGNAIFDLEDGRRPEFRSYYKLPAAQTETENCVAHNGSLVPVPGRDIKVQGWYQGGVSVFDFTDSAQPRRDRLLRPRPAGGGHAPHRRLLVRVLVQRLHLQLRDRARAGRAGAAAQRVPDRERARGGEARCASTTSTPRSSSASSGRRASRSRAPTSTSSSAATG